MRSAVVWRAKNKNDKAVILGGTRSYPKLCWRAVVITMALALASCTPKLLEKFSSEKYDKIDRSRGLSREDYRNMTDPKIPDLVNTVEIMPAPPPPLPTLSQILAAPPPPEIGETQLVSLAVTDDVPLKDVLLELARLADVDMELDSGISGGISFIARDKPFNEVITRIADLAGLRYAMKDNTLRVERDLPYIESYSLDFLNIERSSSSNISISTNVLSGSGGGGGGGLNSGSTQTITSSAQSDFWGSFQSGVLQILNYMPKKRSAETENFEVDGTSVQAGTTGSKNPANMSPGNATLMPGMEDCAIMTQGGPAVGGGSAGTLSGGDCQTFYTINRQAGILTVSATKKQHGLIRRYIEQIKTSASAQVLIEAKIVEISLNDQYQSGIEWSLLNRQLGLTGNFNAIDPTTTNGVFTATLPTRSILGASFGGDVDGGGADLSDFLHLVQEFGTTRTLSSPRLHAINNQQAVLTFAKNYVYFEIDVQREQDTSSGINQELLTVDSTVKTVPIGIILALQPSVNTETGEITLIVRPTLSRIIDFVSDPAVSFLASQGGENISNQVPVVEVREMDSILKLRSGQVMVIGGLMQNSSVNTDSGLPGAQEVPWLGNLFKSVSKQDTTQELIIFIRATLVHSKGNAATADRELYKDFTQDPRPLRF